jgi:lipid A 3-O-deacylase
MNLSGKLLIWLLVSATVTFAQEQQASCDHMFRFYEDNDVIKLFGDVTDKGYTNGTRLDYYYVKKHPSRFFLDKWLPKAGKKAVNTFGLSLTQVMYTPTDIETTQPSLSDWPYSGALYLSHSLHSSNAEHKYNFQTELIAGVMGPAALAKQVQTGVHKVIASPKPMGWENQYPTDVLLNLNFTAEKQIWQLRNRVEVLAGGQVMAGTMMSGASIYAQVRVGKMTPYFEGWIQQFAKPFSQKNKLQVYLIARPALDWIGYNAILEGGIFNGKSDYYKDKSNTADVNHEISRRLDLGIVCGFGNVSVSFTQRIMPKLVDGFGHQRLGNLSLYVGW